MVKTYLFNQIESKAIESKWDSNPLYKSLKTATLSWRKQSKVFYLRPDEVFYHVIRTIDELKTQNDKLELCRYLWDEMYDFLIQKVAADDNEIRNAVSLIVGAVDNCLFCMSELIYWDEINELKLQNAKNNRDSGRQLDALFVRLRKNDTVKEWFTEYMKSPQMISNIIGDDIRKLRNEPTFSEAPDEIIPEGIPQTVLSVFVQPLFAEQYVKNMIDTYFKDKPRNLACIYRVLDDYGFLKEVDNYLEFVTALVDWRMLSVERSRIKNLSDQLGAYMRISKNRNVRRPALDPGFREWGDELKKYKAICENVATVFGKEDNYFNEDGIIHYKFK